MFLLCYLFGALTWHVSNRTAPPGSQPTEKGDSLTREVRHADINRRITRDELDYVENAARAAGLWRFAHEC